MMHGEVLAFMGSHIRNCSSPAKLPASVHAHITRNHIHQRKYAFHTSERYRSAHSGTTHSRPAQPTGSKELGSCGLRGANMGSAHLMKRNSLHVIFRDFVFRLSWQPTRWLFHSWQTKKKALHSTSLHGCMSASAQARDHVH